MNNETKQTAVEELISSVEIYYKQILGEDWEFPNKEYYLQKEKEQMIEFAQEVFRNRYNQITQSLDNIADDIYNETYGGDKWQTKQTKQQ